MLNIFIDESGVHKKDGVSTIALIYVCVNDLPAFDQAIINAERKLGIESFHWSHSTWEMRRKFVIAFNRLDFFLKVAILKNPFKESVDYGRVLEQLITERDIETIVIDGKKSANYERRIKKALGSKGISIRKLRTANDKGYPALRVADACAGIMRYHSDHPNDERIVPLFEAISKKVVDILKDWPFTKPPPFGDGQLGR